MTAMDAHQWILALSSGKVISEDLFKKFICNQFFDDIGTSLGKGIFEDGDFLKYEIRGGYYNYRSECQYIPDTKAVITLLDNNGGRYVGRIAAAIDSIIRKSPFKVPKESLYWAIRDSSGLDAFEVIQYHDYLKVIDPVKYNFDDPDALYYIGQRFFRNGDHQGAKLILNKNIDLFPDHLRTLDLLKNQLFSVTEKD